METFGDFLRAARKKRAMTLGQLALRAHVNKATLSRWESGTNLPRILELGRVLDVLDVPKTARARALRLFQAPRAVHAVRAADAVAEVHVSLGDMLFGLRNRSGKSQETVAQAVGVSRSLVAQWERDGSKPSEAQLHCAGYALGASADEIVALSTRRYAERPIETSRAALLHKLATTAMWDPNVPDAMYGLILMSFLAYLSRQFRQGKADAGDLALLFTKFGESAEFRTGDKQAATMLYERARVFAGQANEPIHFHVIVALRELLDARTNPRPLSERVADALDWKPKFTTNAGKAYLLSFVADALAEESPDKAVLMADEYCALVADDADEYPCRLRDKGNLLYKCERPAESVTFISGLVPQDGFRDGLKHLEMARGLVALGSIPEARRCMDIGKRLLLPTSHASVRVQIGSLEHATN